MGKEESIRAAIQAIRQVYVDSELAEQTAKKLEEYLDSNIGKQRLKLEDPYNLFLDLNAILMVTTHDLHFVFINPQQPSPQQGSNGIIRATPHYIQIYRIESVGDNNVREKFIRIFSKLQNPAILDLRGCIGGDAEALYFILCHLFPDETPLFELQTRSGPPRVFKSASKAPMYETNNVMRKYTGHLKVLVDVNTYSGGEILAKTLQSHGRAKVYGTPTPGAFNVTKWIRFDDVALNLPYGKFIDSIDKTDSEKIGVIPDFGPTTKEYISTIFNDVSEQQFNTYAVK